MPSRAQIELPPEVTRLNERISYFDALDTPLVANYGTEVSDIISEEELHHLFARQAAFLLQSVDPELDDYGIEFATRKLNAPHQYEEPFWRPDTEQPASARVLFPFAAPVRDVERKETELGKPLRMSFGLLRVAKQVRVARATIWLEVDAQSPWPQRLRASKYIHNYSEFDTVVAGERFLGSAKRSAAAARVPLALLLKSSEQFL